MDSFVKYFAVFMCLIYILVGAGLIWGNGAFEVTSVYSVPIGLTLIIYGLFRAYRIYQKYFS
ncbi:MAG: hypothetical protein JSS93_09855 [Bacteroidetes bacterium]|nr:hypothetical protein [Bacteroidota bacterium]